ncbi:MAG TPA: hypothetical protein VJQ82_15180 [Terriglobales bacterium]|nr:hypothetical protein [Terriglobales bacterium]
MESVTKTLRILQLAMLVSIIVYLAIVVILVPHPSEMPNPMILIAITFIAIVDIGVILLMRRFTVSRADAVLREHPDDVGALMRWRSGYIMTYTMGEAIALFGLVLRFIGFTLAQAVPFFLAGFIVILYFGPRRPSNAIG